MQAIMIAGSFGISHRTASHRTVPYCTMLSPGSFGRLVFLAPTKPLVAQQLRAVRKSVGILRTDCAEVTGTISQPDRAKLWCTARHFFLTPQTFVNDVNDGLCPAHELVCVVFDEAHKATGNHHYVQALQALKSRIHHIRVLALSATPGSDAAAMQQARAQLEVVSPNHAKVVRRASFRQSA